MGEEKQFEIEVVGNVFPFKGQNNYVIEQLIDWNNIPHDPTLHIKFSTKKYALAYQLPKNEICIRSL